MKVSSPYRAAALACLAAALVGCASTPEQGAGQAASAAVSDAERLAVALADADAAYRRGDTKQLALALGRVDALGGQPLGDNAAELAQWRSALPESPPMRGRPLGPGFRSGSLPPGESEQLEQVFLSGKRASVALTAPGNERLTLEVQDRRDSAICGREGNPSHCQWVPVFTDRYRIRIANPGRTAVKYFLVVD